MLTLSLSKLPLTRMVAKGQSNPHIVGLTGSFGSGCSYIAENILRDKAKYNLLSLSTDVLRPMFQQVTGQDPQRAPRHLLQEFGDKIRKEKGLGYFAEQIKNKIEQGNDGPDGKWIVDSIRNPEEVRILRHFSRNFFLFGVYAEKGVRWERTRDKYDGNRKDFDEDDENDTGEDNELHGQKVGDCFYEADVVIANNDKFDAIGNERFNNFAGQLFQYIDLIQQPLQRQQPKRQDEALMAIAYAMSQRSSCCKRKVGAIIVDIEGNIISSGYNEVPMHETPCDRQYKKCYRDELSDRFFENLKTELPQVGGEENRLKTLFRKEFKNLDYCRALHAEENAIVNLARYGSPVDLERFILYTTTYPCRMCANRIVKVGLRNVVYLEPYPDQAAASILEHAGVVTRFFEGVTFRAYVRLYGEEK